MGENLFDLTGKVALVTGGNSGIGLGFAEALARAGSDVVIWGRRPEANERAADKLRGFGGRVHAESVDVSDEASIVRGVASALAVMGRIDTVVANAGIASQRAFGELDAAA